MKRLTVNVDQSVDDVLVPVDGGEVQRSITLQMKHGHCFPAVKDVKGLFHWSTDAAYVELTTSSKVCSTPTARALTPL